MMIEFEDHSEEQQRLLLEYLDRLKAEKNAPPAPSRPGCLGRLLGSRPGCLGRLLGRLYLAWLRWRYGRRH